MFLDEGAQKISSSRCRLLAALACALLLTSELVAQVPGELRGRISDAESGRPLGGARVEVLGRGQFVVTQPDGSYLLRGLEPGEVTLRIRAISYSPRDTTAVAVNGRASIVDVALHLAASRLDPIVVRSRSDSATSMVLDRAAIEQSGRRDVGELLLTVPGLVVTQAGGPGSPSRVSIRGSSANEVLVLVDGSPINSSITGEADLSRIGIESVERVTVLPGAQSARYGGRALAGVVAIETRRATSDRTAVATAGAWGEHGASLSVGQRREWSSLESSASLTVDYRKYDGDFTYDVPLVRGGGEARRANADTRALGLIGSASLESERAALRIHAESDSRTRGMPGSIVQPSLTGRQHESRIAGGADARWTSGRVSSNANLDVAHERQSFGDPNPPFGSVFNDTVDATTATLSATSSIAAPSLTSSLGLESRMLDVTSTMLASGSPHVQRQLGVWASERVVRSTAHGLELSADLAARVDWDSLLNGAVTSPRVGVTASRGVTSLAAFFGSGYAPPSLADQFFHEGVLVRPNPSLEPERVRDELEVRAALRDVRIGALDVEAEAATFRANVDGMILWQPDFRFVWSPSNFDVTRDGWDASARVGVPAIGVDAHASVSVSDVEYAGPVLAGQVAYRPKTTGNVSIAVTQLGVRAEASARYIGSRRSVIGSEVNSLEAYSLSDLRVSRTFAARALRIDASLSVENLLDRNASMLVDYPFPGRSWSVSVRTRW